jgi:hypothetical protein
VKSVEDHVIEYRQAQKETKPAERWRKPVIPVAVENDPGTVVIDGGEARPGVNATFDEETIERFRVGRACLHCYEPLEEAFPEQCWLCGYGVRKHQTIDFQEQFEGKKWIGPTTSISDELERLKLDGEERRWKPGSSIILPRGVSG